MPPGPRRLRRRGIAAAFLVAVLSVLVWAGCSATVWISKGDYEPSAERKYRALWREEWRRLAPLNRDLDACNVPGGTRQGCYEASKAMIGGLRVFLDDLARAKAPSRYQAGDATLRQALQMLVAGYARRNQGIAANDNVDFLGGNEALKRANDLLKVAFSRFPPDARAQLNPSL